MVDPRLLGILCCPETQQPLREADPALVADLNRRIAAGTLATRDGRVLATPCDAALVRADGQVAYPIRGTLPILLVSEAIRLA
ncbi:MAG: hypothetical protein RJA22_1682 [Verrucomicrobiota bacterium]|jgi:uncharacterized protein YbaR (Trm112 family)